MRLLPLLAWALLPGCWALTGPDSVQGPVGGSISVSCEYEGDLETHEKFWCKPGTIYACAGPYIIATSEHEPFVRKDRISITDDRTRRVFTVTMRNLTKEDTGTYRCGVERALRSDRHTVNVYVFPVSSSSPPKIASPSAAGHPALTASTSAPTGTFPQEQSDRKEGARRPPHGEHSPARLDLVMEVLTPCIVVVLLLLVLAAGVLVKLSRKRKKVLAGAPIEMHTERSVSNTGTEGSLQYAEFAPAAAAEDGQVYCNMKALPSRASADTSYTEIRPRRQSLQEQREAACAPASACAPEQGLYSNVPCAPRPAEPLYSTVVKPR